VLFGYPAERAVDPAWWGERLHPDDADAARAALAGVVRTGRAAATYRFRRADGSWGWARELVYLFRTPAGGPPELVGAWSDATESLAAEERGVAAEAELRSAAEDYRLLFENNPIPMWIFDRETLRFLAVNDAAVRSYGYARAEFLAKTIADIRPAEDLARLSETLAARHPGYEEAGVWRHRRKSGELRSVEIVSHTLDWEGRPAELIAAVDVTRREETAAALRESEARYRELVEEISDVIFEVDAGGTIRYVSPAIRALSGVEPEELRGRNFLDTMRAEDRARMADCLAHLVRGEDPGPLEFRIGTRGRGTRWVRSRARAIWDNDRITGFRGAVADITDIREAQEKLDVARAQLAQAQRLEAIGRLAGGIAHDFNNALSVIQGFGELALEELPEASPARGAVEEIVRAGERAAGLTRQLLAFGRRQVLLPEAVDLNRAVEEAKAILGRLLGEEIRLEVDLAPGVGTAWIDAGQLQQVLLHLALDARDAMPRGGRLRISTATVELDAVAAVARELAPGHYLELTVEDSGPGVPPQDRERLFEPFFRPAGGGRGAGLGLSMVYGVVRQSRGAIEVDGEAAGGARFRILLPPSAGAEPRSAVEAAHPAAAGASILLVEDEAPVRELARQVLTRAGYRVQAVGNGECALALAEREPFDLLVSDVVMPEMDGPTLALRLRERQPDLPILFLSGYAAETLDERLSERIEFDFLAKPFRGPELVARVRAALGEG
jgi:PAS domain S-box-containing protein